MLVTECKGKVMLSLLRQIIFLMVLPVFGATNAFAQDASLIDGAANGLAIEGYDTVAYFTDHAAIQGSPRFKTNYAGTGWQFKNQAHLDLFLANPDAYIPQYGGHCALGAAHHSLVSGDPDRWRIVDDKLYLNNSIIAQKFWQSDIAGNIQESDRNWPSLSKQLTDTSSK
jgi:YHS domain-containing protein